jgi:hypothetical protein
MNKIKAIYLTTIDNPFNPSQQWDEWRRFDEDHQYFTSQYLARLAKTSTELSEEDYLIELGDTIDRICDLNPIGLYKKLVIYEEDVENSVVSEEGGGA